MTHDPFSNTDTADETFTVDAPYTPPREMEPGRYPARVVDVEKSTSKKGNPMFVWTIAIECDPTGDPWCAGREMKMWTALTEAAMFKVNDTVLALGVGEVVDGVVKAQFKRSDVLNKECSVDIVLEKGMGQYADRSFPRVRSILPPVDIKPNNGGPF